ncbi:DUF1297 domain-containing protein [Candidatus Gottesmanbacteria bacterium]|nr:DUF1297 domain-containing protein [Candidatus Gottesmanbacteria bacterium]
MNNKITIATLGGHSALEIASGAKKFHFNTLIIAQKGREKTYQKYYDHIVDEILLVDHFKELTDKTIKNQLLEKNSIFIPHRYCQVYCDLEKLEKHFKVPIFGNKFLLRYEEREGNKNQYDLMNNASITYPKRFTDPRSIDRLVLVKVSEATRGYERAFFFASNYQEYLIRSGELIRDKKIKREDLSTAVIEEYLIGTQVNFNFFYSPLRDKLELLGTDSRRQTNIDGLLRIPAKQQIEIEHILYPTYIESGHFAVTVKESLLEEAFALAEKLVKSTKKIVPPGIIGPFALQTAILPGPPKEKIVVFDISLRIPGSPGTIFTPYSHYLYDRPVSFGERIALEIRNAQKFGQLQLITT